MQVGKQQDRRNWEFSSTRPEEIGHRTSILGFLFSFRFLESVVCIPQEAQSTPFKRKNSTSKRE